MPSKDDVADELAEVSGLLADYRMGEAETRILQVLDEYPVRLLVEAQNELQATANQFFPKRRREITKRIASILKTMETVSIQAGTQSSLSSVTPTVNSTEKSGKGIEVEKFRLDLTSGFSNLSSFHIFQWSTHYRDFIAQILDKAYALASDPEHADIVELCRAATSKHAKEIFEKGYKYQVSANQSEMRTPRRAGYTGKPTADHAIAKSINGLERFMSLPVDWYATAIHSVQSPEQSLALRRIVSSCMSGIIVGYARTKLGRQYGANILPSLSRTWLPQAVFLTAKDLELVISSLEPGVLANGLSTIVFPTMLALDNLLTHNGFERPPLPVLGQLSWPTMRFDISLLQQSTTDVGQYLDVHCYVDHTRLVRENLEEEAARGANAIIVAGLRSGIREWAEAHPALRHKIVNAFADEAAPDQLTTRIVDALRSLLKRETGIHRRSGATYNVARYFPYQQAVLPSFFRITRTSVRHLLSTFEGRNGIRLWCSVRRSGKTTACFDLSSTSASTQIVSQTCEYVGLSAEGSLNVAHNARYLIDRVIGEAEAHPRRTIAPDFFLRVVRESAPMSAEVQRYVLVLDEYETLFRRLVNWSDEEPLSRDRVAQPLMNQMVEFAQENLIIFVGQQPDAHYIFMAQNQLSPYVRQDRFPLFEHDAGSETSEFALLINRILGGGTSPEVSFVSAVYDETGGHPYLTVKLLVHLLDWILERRSVLPPHIAGDDFHSFVAEALRPSKISETTEYDLLFQAAKEALSPKCLRQVPWMHTVYTALQTLARDAAADLTLSKSEFLALLRSCPGFQELGLPPEKVLQAAAGANFFEVTGDVVRPKVRLLTRLANAVP